MDPLEVGATWLHAVAMVIALGYYAVLGWIVLPALERGGVADASVVAIERRALPLVALSIVVFTASGLYLMLGDGRYAGPGNVTASTWTMLMLLKHVVVAVMVGLGVSLHFIATRGERDGPASEALQAGPTPDPGRIRTIRWLADGIAILGAVVLLLTAAAQVSS